MSSFAIKTPLLVESVADLRFAAAGLRSRTMDVKTAGTFAKLSDETRRHVETDLKTRLASKKLHEIEASLITSGSVAESGAVTHQ